MRHIDSPKQSIRNFLTTVDIDNRQAIVISSLDEEWNQGEAITLTDMFEEPSKLMHQT